MSIHWRSTPEDTLYFQDVDYSTGQPISPSDAKDLATRVALRGAGSVSPNPLVGCVLVDKSHNFVAADYHAEYGEAHAEARLLSTLEQQNRTSLVNGGTLYLTLEPCAHEGKTPSCAKALATTKLKKIVCAHQDPNPLVNGEGFKILSSNGIDYELDESFRLQSQSLVEAFFWNQIQNSPFVALKIAQSLDAKSSYIGDSRTWITCQRARDFGHWLRLYYDAILVGANTIIQDNPTLNVRHPNFLGRSPKKIVYDPSSRGIKSIDLPKLNLLENGSATVLWVCSRDEISHSKMEEAASAGIVLISVKGSLKKSIKQLKEEHRIHSILVEGGPNTWSQFIQEHEFQKLHLFQSMDMMGSKNTVASTEELISNTPIKMSLNTVVTPLDTNLLIETYPTQKEEN